MSVTGPVHLVNNKVAPGYLINYSRK